MKYILYFFESRNTEMKNEERVYWGNEDTIGYEDYETIKL